MPRPFRSREAPRISPDMRARFFTTIDIRSDSYTHAASEPRRRGPDPSEADDWRRKAVAGYPVPEGRRGGLTDDTGGMR